MILSRECKTASPHVTLRGGGTHVRAREPHTVTATQINAHNDAADPKWLTVPYVRA